MRLRDVCDEDFHFSLKGHPLRQDSIKKTFVRLVNAFRQRCKVRLAGDDASCGDFISTGFQPLDDVISGKAHRDRKTKRLDVIPGTGRGLPCGRIAEVYGEEAAAKTSLCLAIIANAQRTGHNCAFIDAEHALNREFARNTFDVDLSTLLHMEPESGEEGAQCILESVKAGFDLVVVDSVSALVPEDELRGKAALGMQARLMSSLCRKLAGLAKRHNAIVIFINQTRSKIGVMFGDPTTTSGGNALKFYASVRISLAKRASIKIASRVKGRPCQIGQEIDLHVTKNKIAPPHQRLMFKMFYADGFVFPKPLKLQHDDESKIAKVPKHRKSRHKRSHKRRR